MSPTCFEPRGFIRRETVVYAIWYVLQIPIHINHTIQHIQLSLSEDESTKFETRRRRQKLNIDLENCVFLWFGLCNYITKQGAKTCKKQNYLRA
jgi:hypothetical protein